MMKSRDSKLMDLKYGDSPGYRFCKEMIKLIDLIKPQITDKLFFSSFGNLQDAYSKLEPKMLSEEDSRSCLSIPASLYRRLDIKKHDEIKQALQVQLDKIQKEFKEKKDALLRRKADLVNQIETEIKNEMTKKLQTEAEYKRVLDPLTAEIHTLEDQCRLKEKEIDERCCSCLSTASKEQAELGVIKEKILLTNKKILELQKNPPKEFENEDRKRMEVEQLHLVVELSNLEAQFSKSQSSAQKTLDDLVAKYKEDKANFDERIDRHFSPISKEAMLLYVRVYACFLDLKKKIGESEVFKTDKGEEFKSVLKDSKIQLDLPINKLRCPNFSNLRAMEVFFQNVRKMDEDKILLFLGGKLNADIEKILLPPQQASLQLNANGATPVLFASNSLKGSPEKPSGALALLNNKK